MAFSWKKLFGRNRAASGDTGLLGEQLAARFLEQQAYKILGRRVRVGKRDEIDLVARIGEVLVFVEVKTRSREDFGRPMDSVDRAKRAHLSRAAVRYLGRLKRKPDYFRFDVVEVVMRDRHAAPEIRHIENAFNLDRKYQVPEG